MNKNYAHFVKINHFSTLEWVNKTESSSLSCPFFTQTSNIYDRCNYNHKFCAASLSSHTQSPNGFYQKEVSVVPGDCKPYKPTQQPMQKSTLSSLQHVTVFQSSNRRYLSIDRRVPRGLSCFSSRLPHDSLCIHHR